MDVLTVSFFGHRQIRNPLEIERKLEGFIDDLLLNGEYMEFLVGRAGDFDQLVSSTIRRRKRAIRDDNSAHIWVMPYETAIYRNDEEAILAYYDEVEICEQSAGKHFKGAHAIRNRCVIERSNLVVCCVEHASGGAYQAMRYAQEPGKPCVNLARQRDAFQGWGNMV